MKKDTFLVALLYCSIALFVFVIAFIFGFYLPVNAAAESTNGLPIRIEPIPNYESLQGQAIDSAVTYAVNLGILESGEDYVVLNSYVRNSGSTLLSFYLTVIPADSFSCDFSDWETLRLFTIDSVSDFVNIQVYTNGYIESPFNNGGAYHWQFNSDHLYDFYLGRIVATRNITRIYDVDDRLVYTKNTDSPPVDLHSLNPDDYETPGTDLPDPDDDTNLIGSIKGFFQGLIDKIVQAVNNVKNAIVDGFNVLFQNLQSLFNGITEFFQSVVEGIQYIIEPVDSDRFVTAFSGSTFYTQITGIFSVLSNFQGVILGQTEPTGDHYYITIPLSDIEILNCNDYQLDLGILGNRTLLRSIVGCLTVFGVIYSILDCVPNYIDGGGNES